MMPFYMTLFSTYICALVARLNKYKRSERMKNIAEKLKTARESTRITIEEAAEDLNYKVSSNL